MSVKVMCNNEGPESLQSSVNLAFLSHFCASESAILVGILGFSEHHTMPRAATEAGQKGREKHAALSAPPSSS